MAAAQKSLSQLAKDLRNMGYTHLTQSGDHISGSVYGVDLTDAPRSVPEGENTGPMPTLDNAEQHIPENLQDFADEHGLRTTVLGHGPGRLHVYLTRDE